MSIKVKQSTMVCPAKETPRESLWLSKIDMIVRKPYTHTNVLFLYPHPTCHTSNNNNNSNGNNTCSEFFNFEILKEALSKSLVPFYPMAGRLKFNKENGRYEIDCNAKGALFIEAEATQAVADYGDYTRLDSELRKLVFPRCDYSGGLSSFPLLMVQLTRFDCGGVCLGYALHHHVADGYSHVLFNKSWARLAKGLDLIVQPIHDRASYLAPRHPPQVKFQHLEYEPPVAPKVLSDEMVTTTDCMLELTKDQINTLKQLAHSQGAPTSYKFSTFEVLAGHMWGTVCKSRELDDDQDVKLYMPVNGRSRLKDKGPLEGYYGNLYFVACCLGKAGDITRKPLWYAASKIRETLMKMNDVEYLRSAIDYIESHPNLETLVRGPQQSACPNFKVSSWAWLPRDEADFGWGKPKFVGISGIKSEGQSYIIPSTNGDGSVSIAIKLFTPHMKLFKKYFYADASRYPGRVGFL